MVRKRPFQAARSLSRDGLRPGGDLEPGYMRRVPRFKDVVDMVIVQNRTIALQKQLREGIDTKAFERYRTSDEEVSQSCVQRLGPIV